MKGLDFLFRRRACALLVTAIALAGCAGSNAISTPPPDPPGNFVALTSPIIMLGDTQEHEATGFPLQDNDNAIDAYVEVAQRPAEQPLFGRRVLEWVLENHAGEPVIHLGDVMDVSCASEGERLGKIMAAAKQEGAILPGNHDGLMFGIFNYDIAAIGRDRDSERWDRACRRAAYLDGDPDAPPKGKGGAYTKRDFIVSYLQGIIAKAPPGTGPGLPPAEGGDWRLSWRSPRPEPFIEAIEVLVTPAQRFAGSFMAQKLRLPRGAGKSARRHDPGDGHQPDRPHRRRARCLPWHQPGQYRPHPAEPDRHHRGLGQVGARRRRHRAVRRPSRLGIAGP